MNWQDYITADPAVLAGKPVVKGTRLSVEFLLGLCAKGWSEREIFDAYPHLPPEGLKAVFAFAAETVREEAYFEVRSA